MYTKQIHDLKKKKIYLYFKYKVYWETLNCKHDYQITEELKKKMLAKNIVIR